MTMDNLDIIVRSRLNNPISKTPRHFLTPFYSFLFTSPSFFVSSLSPSLSLFFLLIFLSSCFFSLLPTILSTLLTSHGQPLLPRLLPRHRGGRGHPTPPTRHIHQRHRDVP